MEQRLIAIFCTILLSACVQHSDSESDISITELPLEQMQVNYAKGFTLEYTAQYTKVKTRSINGNSFFLDSIYLQHTDKAELEELKVIDREGFEVCSQSSTHLAYIDHLNKINSVKGLCGLQYVNKGRLALLLQGVGTKEICIGDAVQSESILALNPDLYFIYPFETEQSELEAKGIKTFMIAEYLEQHPIARLEWIKLFGLIYGEEEKANTYFERTEETYFNLVKEERDRDKRFILNLPFGENWDAPSSNSLLVTLLQDAGMYYHFQDDAGTENTIHPKEKIWEAGATVPYWVIIADRPADFSLADLTAEEEAYTAFEAVQKKQVIFCNSSTSGYFIEGVLEPHIMLKDILFATGELAEHTPKYFHILN